MGNSTAQSIHVYDKGTHTNKSECCNNANIEKWDLEEPSTNESNSIFNHHHCFSNLSTKSSDSKDPRIHRKHLLDLNEYKLDILGSKWDLTKYLHGQPIKIYAGCDDDVFWSFDIWHDSLLSQD